MTSQRCQSRAGAVCWAPEHTPRAAVGVIHPSAKTGSAFVAAQPQQPDSCVTAPLGTAGLRVLLPLPPQGQAPKGATHTGTALPAARMDGESASHVESAPS